ncbi:MAG: STT3 domain-containing protein, partial [Sulfurimonas sp.]
YLRIWERQRDEMTGKKLNVENTNILLLMLIAYLFSFAIRMIWVWQFQDNPNFYWNDQLMINTNDGYTWAASAQQVLFGMHESNPGIRDMWANGIIFFTVLFAKITPFSLETVILYMPAVISSLVVIPVILIARLYGQALWGFFAALLGAIAWSYYNRTMTGYYDTDMFSAMAPMFILYFLMKSTIDFNLKNALYAAIFISVYPFLYDQGASIIYAMGIIYGMYLVWYHRDEKLTYISMLLVFLAMIPFGLPKPYEYLAHILLVTGLYFALSRTSLSQKQLMVGAGIALIALLVFGNVFGLIWGKMMAYMSTGTKTEGLHFYGVHQTVREAGKIPFETFANRISGSIPGLIAAMLGYLLLIVKHRAFLLALPLAGIGMFALWGGLRFTVYAVPVAAMSAIYLFFVLGEFFKNPKFKYLLAAAGTAGMLYPNITHIVDYRVPTVLSNAEVKDLQALKEIADPKDYTLAWWDYGYPVWFYSETSTLIDGGKHQNDNFIISKILQTSSPELAASLGRLAVETYESSNHGIVADTLFKNRQKDQLDPNLLLAELESSTYKLPSKTRDIYLYLPYRMLNIFPTVSKFGNLDLNTGKPLRKMAFYPTGLKKKSDKALHFANGIVMDMQKGELRFGRQMQRVQYFIVADSAKGGKVRLQSQRYHADGQFAVVYMKSYGRFVVMDMETFHSAYIQMFVLGKYDKELFEPVVSSPYSKIYRLKR